MKLQICGWNEFFENSKSRERDRCSFVCVPNKQDGLGFTRVLSEPDGAAVYGIWHMILGACSRQSRPRDGYLTDTGRADGEPWSVSDMAMRWRRPEAEIAHAIEVLTSAKVGWIKDLDDDRILNVRQVPAEYPSGALEGKGIEEKGMEENAAGAACDEGQKPLLAVAAIPLMEFPTKGKTKTWPLSEQKLAEYREAFPGVDVDAECRKALQWVRDNPTKKKTAARMPSFLNGWFSRHQNNHSERTPQFTNGHAGRFGGGPAIDPELLNQFQRKRAGEAIGFSPARQTQYSEWLKQQPSAREAV